MKQQIIWHIPEPGAPLPYFYASQDYVPEKVRLMAGIAPSSDCEIDIRDDGVSIFANRISVIEKRSTVYSEIGYNNLSGTFTVGEFITGGTSSARGIIISNKRGNIELTLVGEISFSVNETITGASSGATATVLSFYRGGNPVTYTAPTAKNGAILSAGETLEENAEDFPSSVPTIEAGSILTCHEIDLKGAKNVTVQLEMESTDDDEEEGE